MNSVASSRSATQKQLPENFSTNFNKLKQKLEGKNDPFVTKLRDLYTGCKSLSLIAPSFDLNEENPGNGFRSFIKILSIYFSHLVALLEKPPSKKRIRLLYDYEMVASGFLRIMTFMQLVAKRECGLEDTDYYREESIDRKILDAILAIEEKELTPYLSSIQNFWLAKSVRGVMNNIITKVIIWKTTPVLRVPEVMLSKGLRASAAARYALNGTTEQVRGVWGFGEEALNRAVIGMRNTVSSGSVKTLKIPRQKNWILTPEGQLTHQFMGVDENTIPVEKAVEAITFDRTDSVVSRTSFSNNNNESDNNNKKVPLSNKSKRRKSSSAVADTFCYSRATKQLEPSVRCSWITYTSPSAGSPKNSLILHLHGGGYIALSPKSHEQYLRVWSKKTKVPVISVDYGLSPENKYPSALQEALDVYLFLTSGDERVKNTLGFHPENIVLCGDSAGGNMAIALCYILNDLKTHLSTIERENQAVTMPAAVCVQYPCANPTISCHSASRLFTAFDSLLSVSAVYACAGSYLDVGAQDDEDKPWFRKSQSHFTEVVENILLKKSDPYVNTLSYERAEELADVELYVQAAEFDPLLDDSISIAKLWKGKVTLDITPNVMHGYLAFLDFSNESIEACDVTIGRIKEALKLNDVPERQEEGNNAENLS